MVTQVDGVVRSSQILGLESAQSEEKGCRACGRDVARHGQDESPAHDFMRSKIGEAKLVLKERPILAH